MMEQHRAPKIPRTDSTYVNLGTDPLTKEMERLCLDSNSNPGHFLRIFGLIQYEFGRGLATGLCCVASLSSEEKFL